MSDQTVIVGQCTGITEKPSGWTEFQIAVAGNRYPVKLATKLQPLIDDARAVRDGIATWTYTEVESENVNPNSGKPYINRYLEKVEAGAAAGAGASDPDQPQPHHEPVHFADKDRLITRQTCLKAASGHPGGGDDWAADVIAAAARFETWLYRDIDDVPF